MKARLASTLETRHALARSVGCTVVQADGRRCGCQSTDPTFDTSMSPYYVSRCAICGESRPAWKPPRYGRLRSGVHAPWRKRMRNNQPPRGAWGNHKQRRRDVRRGLAARRKRLEEAKARSAAARELRGDPPLKPPRGGPKAATRWKLFEAASRHRQISLPQYLEETKRKK